MKLLLTLLRNLRILLLCLLFVSCGTVSKDYIKTLVKREMKELNKNELQNRIKDNSLSEMSIEEFQILAKKYFGNARIRLEPFYYVGKKQAGTIMKTEGVLYYVQSFSGRGAMHTVNAEPLTADLKVGISVSGENYFLSDATYYLIINDFVCDEMSILDLPWTGGGVPLDDNAIYAVGWKAVLY